MRALSGSPARRDDRLPVQAGALSSPSMKSSWAIQTANHSEDGDLGGQARGSKSMDGNQFSLGFNFRGSSLKAAAGPQKNAKGRGAVALPVQFQHSRMLGVFRIRR